MEKRLSKSFAEMKIGSQKLEESLDEAFAEMRIGEDPDVKQELKEPKVEPKVEVEDEPEEQDLLIPTKISEEDLKTRITGIWQHSSLKWDVALKLTENEFAVGWIFPRCNQKFPIGNIEGRRTSYFKDSKWITVQYDKEDPLVEKYRREWFFITGNLLVSVCEMAQSKVIVCHRKN